jgi:hypothetical protein
MYLNSIFSKNKFNPELYVTSKTNKALATISWSVTATVKTKSSKNPVKKIKGILKKEKSAEKNQVIKILDNGTFCFYFISR